MQDETMFDAETGEVYTAQTTSEAAKAANHPAPDFVAGPGLMLALEKAVADLPVWITTDKDVEPGSNRARKYATLKQIMTVVRPVLIAHGIRIRQGTNPSWTLDTGASKGRLVPVYTDLIHSHTGETDRTIVEIPVAKMDAQAMGSAISYGRRYGLLAALGLTTDEAEDDGAGTKARDITQEHEESQNLWVCKEEINAITDLAKLHAWGDKAQKDRRVTELNDAEAALLRAHFKARIKAISEGAGKPKKAEKDA